MKLEPLSAEQKEARQIDILIFVHQSQKAESLQHRQNLFNAFAGWVAALLVIIGAVIAIHPPSPLDNTITKVIAGIVVSLLSSLVIVFMWRQRFFPQKG